MSRHKPSEGDTIRITSGYFAAMTGKVQDLLASQFTVYVPETGTTVFLWYDLMKGDDWELIEPDPLL